ncbi:TonB-dependent receptor plug domain-containing protein [Aquidulcibacter sp.]|uniref:TonB-dependent receptor plug domain-containing protein n=1 Tax=Aquidulcibacter sp. TaxID=2052990 RepID=UPI003BA44B15
MLKFKNGASGLAVAVSLLAVGVTLPAVSQAQEATSADTTKVGEVVVVTGTRTRGRTVADSAVPVDVLTSEAITAVAFTDTQDVLKTLVPSFNTFRQPISDGATFIRPATLRGLTSDKTLVLVNSKRRHRAALVTIGGSGTQGPDVATIPASALKTVEVLRDGAAAQYGSDAIAGVLNFILKDNDSGGELSASMGQYTEGDGDDITVSGNLGLPIGESGFVSISVEANSAKGTNRGDQWSRAQSPQFDTATGVGSGFDVALYRATYPQFAGLFGPGTRNNTSNVQIWGQPENVAFRSFVNAGYKVSDKIDLYAFANYSNSEGSGDFNYRFPDPEFGQTPNPNGSQGTLGPAIRLQNGTTWTGTSKFPAGYTPRFSGNVIDYSLTAGVRGDLSARWSYDATIRYGYNKISYGLSETQNPSYGPASPTSFSPGDLVADETAFNLDFSYELPVAMFASPLTISYGAEYRSEGYELVEGDRASWAAGPYAKPDPWGFCNLAQPIATRTPTAAGLAVIAAGSTLNCASASDPVYRLLGVGSDGFPGNNPDYSGAIDRASYAVYVDLEADVTDKLFVGVAGRFEDYEDFGSTTDGKIAARYELTDDINLRASIGTGFRAPTPGQLSTANVSTRFPASEPVASGLFPATNPVSLFLGAKPLEPERSKNYSAGVTAAVGDFNFTLDFYQIDIEGQFYATRSITVTPTIQAALIAANVPGANTIGAVQFFQNAFDSVTKGVDFVGTYRADFGDYGKTNFTLSANYNTFKVGDILIGSPSALLFLEEDVYDFENGVPEFKSNFTINHSIGKFSGMLRANYWGEYTASNCLTSQPISVFKCPTSTVYPEGLIKQKLGSEVLIDMEVSYDFPKDVIVTLGARNITNEYPDEGAARLGETGNGRVYRSDSLVDWQGTYYYLKIKKTF